MQEDASREETRVTESPSGDSPAAETAAPAKTTKTRAKTPRATTTTARKPRATKSTAKAADAPALPGTDEKPAGKAVAAAESANAEAPQPAETRTPAAAPPVESASAPAPAPAPVTPAPTSVAPAPDPAPAAVGVPSQSVNETPRSAAPAMDAQAPAMAEGTSGGSHAAASDAAAGNFQDNRNFENTGQAPTGDYSAPFQGGNQGYQGNEGGRGNGENYRNDQRPLEPRGLRFRGREGRAELRARPDNRPFRGRDNREQRDRDNNQPGRLMYPQRMQQGEAGRGDGGRGEGGRGEGGRGDGGRGEGGRGDGGRGDGGRDNRNDRENRMMERDIIRGRNDFDLPTLEEKNLQDLREIAKGLNIAASSTMKKTDLVYRILEVQAETSGNLFKRGILEILPDGRGFLRTDGYLASDEDVYVSQSQIKRFNLKTGDMVSGQVRAPKEMERHYGLLRVEALNGEPPENLRTRKEFEKLTPIFPDEKFQLETTQENITARIIDLVSPIGKGQRGLIVAPPKAGKTSLIKNVANSIMANHPDVMLIVLLIDERPEEVTDISRSVKGEVVASTFDELPENHIRVADMVLEKAKRMVEQKKDVVILLDSITRLSRASNLVVTPSGRTMSGGLDPAAMYKPKRLFGAARNIEEGGSLTILATVLVDTGSRMDEYIFEELKGTGNMDLVLDRSLFDQRIFPAIDINKSGTRRDDLLLSKEDLAATFHLRRTLAALDNDKAVNLLIDRLKNTKTNADFMQIVQKSSQKNNQ